MNSDQADEDVLRRVRRRRLRVFRNHPAHHYSV